MRVVIVFNSVAEVIYHDGLSVMTLISLFNDWTEHIVELLDSRIFQSQAFAIAKLSV